jgi:hypothetical protein
MSVARGTAVNLFARLAAVGLVLAITAFTARMGTAQQGAFALFTSVEAVLLALFSGFGIALARRVSHHQEQPRALMSALICASVVLGTVAGVLMWLVSAHGPAAYGALWLLALAAPVLLLAPNIAGWWLGEGRMGPMAVVSLAPPALTLVALWLLWLGGMATLVPVLAAWVGAKAVVGIGAVLAMARARRLAPPRWAPVRLAQQTRMRVQWGISETRP